jgi:hypothetical protein
MALPAADAGVPDQGSGDFAPVMVPCTMEPTPEKYCKLMDIVCKTEADCPSLFACRQSAVMTAPSSGTCAPVEVDGGLTCGGAAPLPPVLRCQPPYDSISGETVSDGSKTEPGYPVTMPNTMPANPMTANPPPVDSPTPRPGTGMNPGSTTSGGFTPAPTGTPGEASEVPAMTPRRVKACMVVAPGSGTANSVLWIMLTALLVLSLRRRRNA